LSRCATCAFGGIRAVDHVTLDLYPGEVVGRSGPQRRGQVGADEDALGRLSSAIAVRSYVNGEEAIINNPRDARKYNIETIYQTLALADNLDAASNLFLGRELVTRFGMVDDATMEAETRKIMGGSTRTSAATQGPGLGPFGRSAAVGGDRAGGLFQRQDPDHGRAHGGPRPARDADGRRTDRGAEEIRASASS
jgi:hypothetical protein